MDSDPSSFSYFITLAFEVASESQLKAKNASIPTSKSFQNQFPNTFDSEQHESLIFAGPPMQFAHLCLSRGYENQ